MVKDSSAYKRGVYRVTQWKDGMVFKTQKVRDIWLRIKPRTIEEENAIAKRFGGDFLTSSTEYRFGVSASEIDYLD